MSFKSLASLTWERVILTFLQFLLPFGSWVIILAPGYMNARHSPCRGKTGAVLIPSIRGRHLLCWQQTWHWAAVKVVKNKLYADFHLSHSFPSSSRCLSPLTLRQCFTFIAHFWKPVEFYLLFGWSVQWHCSVWCYRLWLQIWQIGDRQRFYGKFRDLISVSP